MKEKIIEIIKSKSIESTSSTYMVKNNVYLSDFTIREDNLIELAEEIDKLYESERKKIELDSFQKCLNKWYDSIMNKEDDSLISAKSNKPLK